MTGLMARGVLLLVGMLLPFLLVRGDLPTLVLLPVVVAAEIGVWKGFRAWWGAERLQEALNAGMVVAFCLGCVYELLTWGSH